MVGLQQRTDVYDVPRTPECSISFRSFSPFSCCNCFHLCLDLVNQKTHHEIHHWHHTETFFSTFLLKSLNRMPLTNFKVGFILTFKHFQLFSLCVYSIELLFHFCNLQVKIKTFHYFVQKSGSKFSYFSRSRFINV